MKKLYIIGKAPIKEKIKELKDEDTEIWMCGTDPRQGADAYFELHGIVTNKPCTYYSLPDKVYEMGLPINNTISALVVYAYIKGYKDITILGCPMSCKIEYIQQRPSLAYVVGWCNGRGIHVEWVDAPKNNNYGR